MNCLFLNKIITMKDKGSSFAASEEDIQTMQRMLQFLKNSLTIE
jgi:hypothetical protein